MHFITSMRLSCIKMEEEGSMNNLDRVLMELVFQIEQDTQKNEALKEQIQIYTSSCLDEKQQILEYQEKLKSCDDKIFNLQKFSKSSREIRNTWKSTNDILTSHEDKLQSELESEVKITENEKIMYQDKLNQCKETFRYHQEKYMETPLAKTYYMKKQELDELQNKILQYREQRTKEEKHILDITGRAPFTSYNEWALQLATLRKNTYENFEQTARISLKTSDTETQCRLLELRLQHVKQQAEHISKQDSSVVAETLDLDNFMQPEERIFNNREESRTSTEKQKPELLNDPSLQRRIMHPQRDIKLIWQMNETGNEEKGKCRNQRTYSIIPSIQRQTIEKDPQKSAELTDKKKDTHAEPEINLHKETERRFDNFQKPVQPMLISTERDLGNYAEDVPSTSNVHESQGTVPGNYEEMEIEASPGDASLHKVPTYFSVTDSPATLCFKHPDLGSVKKVQESTVPITDMVESTKHQKEESVPFKCFLAPSPKSPTLSMSLSGLSTDRPSHLKDSGTIFWKMGGEDKTSFMFASKPPQTLNDEEEDFVFLFGQNQEEDKPSQSSFTFF
uniref:Protein SIX6OS1 n=1 Tax=Leptobrachium leishanense TaxID=445787 RepID=A0A8C5MVN2_9ANUR